MNNKIYKKLFVGFGFVSIVLILTLFVMSQTYIQNLVYHERLSQMEEVTHQMFHSLEDVIDNHWDEVDVQCNYLYNTPLETVTDLYRYLKKLSELSNYHEKQIELIAVDAAGRYYTEYGRTGLLREMNYLEKRAAAGQLCFQFADRGRLPDGVSGTALHPHHTAKRRERDHPALLWYFAEHDPAERLFPLRRLRK